LLQMFCSSALCLQCSLQLGDRSLQLGDRSLTVSPRLFQATPSHTFFPCHHLCACKGCIDQYNIGHVDKPEKPAWRACPLCNDPFKQLLPHTGDEGKKYW
jgi:hypothetical protein